MAKLCSIVLVIIFGSVLSAGVNKFKQSVEYKCIPTQEGNGGTFDIRVFENGALSLDNVQYEAMDENVNVRSVCIDQALFEELTPREDPDNQWSFEVATEDTLACGLRIPNSANENTFELSFRTRSLSDAFSSKDKKYILTCNFDEYTSTIESAGVAIFSSLDEDTIESTLPMFSIEIMKYSQSYPNGRVVYHGGSITINDKLRIIITLDISSGFNGFRVKTCTFSRTGDADATLIIIGLNTNPSSKDYCPTVEGIFLGLSEDGVFVYDSSTNGNDYVAISALFDSFTFELEEGQTASSLICEVEYCNDDDAQAGDCLPAPSCEVNDDDNVDDVDGDVKRRKRSTQIGNTKYNTTQLLTFFTFGKPTHQELIRLDPGQNIDRAETCEVQATTGYLIGLIVLALALVLTMAMALFMFFRRAGCAENNKTRA